MEFEINPEAVQSLKVNGTGFVVLDVREPWEVATAHIEGSVHIPMGELAARAHQELDAEQHVIVVCHHGVRSLNVTHWLRQQGFKQVQSMRGGISAWSRAVDSKVPVY
jgi:rhodanese-related sulfurtransferase